MNGYIDEILIQVREKIARARIPAVVFIIFFIHVLYGPSVALGDLINSPSGLKYDKYVKLHGVTFLEIHVIICTHFCPGPEERPFHEYVNKPPTLV